MGLTFAKSVKVGAVRFNLSGAGIGMSVGIPGLRIGMGPRGAYIAGGAGGFRYRRSLGLKPKVASSPAPTSYPSGSNTAEQQNIISTVVHDDRNVLELCDASGDELLQSMNEQRAKAAMWPWVALGLAVAYGLCVTTTGLQLAANTLLAVGMAAIAWAAWRDQMRKLTVLFYEPDQVTSTFFENLCSGLEYAAAAKKLKSIATTSRYADTKYSAGATQGLKFGDATLKLGNAPGVVANVSVPVMISGKTTLAFYPDRILAFQGNAVGSFSYSILTAEAVSVQFIESEVVPSDAKIIDRTWQYVNKKGGPDKRFKDNRELPICAYSQLNLSTPDGLDVRFLASKERGFDRLAQMLRAARV